MNPFECAKGIKPFVTTLNPPLSRSFLPKETIEFFEWRVFGRNVGELCMKIVIRHCIEDMDPIFEYRENLRVVKWFMVTGCFDLLASLSCSEGDSHTRTIDEFSGITFEIVYGCYFCRFCQKVKVFTCHPVWKTMAFLIGVCVHNNGRCDGRIGKRGPSVVKT